MSAFGGAYPWLTARCADIDITGHRLPQSYYREIVFGRRTDPYLAVQRPEHHGKTVVHSSPWSWSDVVSSWSWDGHEGAPVMVEVYADADEVELSVNGRTLGRAARRRRHRFRAEFETAYEPGVLDGGRLARRPRDRPRRAALGDRSGAARGPRRPRRRSAPTPPIWRSSS